MKEKIERMKIEEENSESKNGNLPPEEGVSRSLRRLRWTRPAEVSSRMMKK